MKIDYNDYDPRYRMSWAMGIMQRYDGDHGNPEEAAKEICQLCDAHMEAHKPAHEAKPVGDRPRDCQHGHDDVCLMAQFDGVCCPDESCDIDDGIRKPPEAATQPVGEWFTLDMMSELCDKEYGHGKMLVNLVKGDFDRVLTKYYGHPPIVRTFNGEPASEWGLEEDDFVLWWHVLNYWTTCRYSGLAKGDQWMMQLPAPKGGSDED